MIAVIGQSVLDRTRWPDGQSEDRLGGSPVFAARALAGVAPAVVITHGADAPLRQPLHDLVLEVWEGPSEQTTVFEVAIEGDGGWHESITALGDPFTPGDVESWMKPALTPCSAVVCGAQWRNDFPVETLALLARGGRRVYLDGQGAARPRRLGPIRLEGPLDPRLVANVEVLKLGGEEALTLLGGIDAAVAESFGVPVVVVTLGDRGAVVLADGVATPIRVEPVDVADTVGAGDSFLALMASAIEIGADPIVAAGYACDGVARLLRLRLSAQRDRERQLASTRTLA